MATKALTEDGRARILADGNEIPLLGLGVWQVPNGPEVENAVRWALELGERQPDLLGGGVEAGREVGSPQQAPHPGDAPQEPVGLLQVAGDDVQRTCVGPRRGEARPGVEDQGADVVGGRGPALRRPPMYLP